MHPIAGSSGNIYDFEVYKFESLPDIANCIYIYINETKDSFIPIYIGMTTRTIKERYAEHDYDDINECSGFNDANCIFIHHKNTLLTRYSESELQYIEADLLKKYNTPCNTKNN